MGTKAEDILENTPISEGPERKERGLVWSRYRLRYLARSMMVDVLPEPPTLNQRSEDDVRAVHQRWIQSPEVADVLGCGLPRHRGGSGWASIPRACSGS